MLIIISGLKLIGSDITPSKDLITPSYRVGTVVQSETGEYRTELQKDSDGSDSPNDIKKSSQFVQGVSASSKIPSLPPGDVGLDLSLEITQETPKYIINNVPIFEDKKYCVYTDYGNYIIKGSSFQPYQSDERFFNFKIQDDLALFVENRYHVYQIADGPKGPQKLKSCKKSAFTAPEKEKKIG